MARNDMAQNDIAQYDNVVITGMGVVSPIGIGVDAYWESMISKKSGVSAREDIGSMDSPFSIAGHVPNFEPQKYVKPRKSLKVMCRPIQMGFAASDMAITQAGLTESDFDRGEIATVFGCESFYATPVDFISAFEKCIDHDQFQFEKWGNTFRREIEPLWMLKYLPNMVASHISIAFDARGPSNTIIQSDASSLLAIIESAQLIDRGKAQVAICGGTGCISELTGAIYRGSMLLSHQIDDPASACKPYDVDRDGTVLGEGAATYIMETESTALARGKPVLARVLSSARGYGSPNDMGQFAKSITSVISKAVERSNIRPSDFGHVNANGSGMISMDHAESIAISNVLGNVPVLAPKGHFGSLGGGSGAVELIASLLAYQHGTIPPTMNCNNKDDLCPINVLTESVQPDQLKPALVINLTAQGQIVALVIGPN